MPCVNETCSVTPTVDAVSGELTLDVNVLDPSTGTQGGIFCGSQGGDSGIYVGRYGNQAPAAAPAVGDVSLIGITTGGSIYANKTPVGRLNLGDSALVAIPNDGGTSVDALNVNYTNTTANPQLVHVHTGRAIAQLRTTNATTPPTREAQYEYRGTMRQQLSIADITGGTEDIQRIDTGPNLFKTDGRDLIRVKKFHQVVRVPAAAVLNIRHYIVTDTRTNLINLGFITRENFLIIQHTT